MFLLNFNWTVYPDSRIARLRPVFLQKLALILRNLAAMARRLRQPRRLANPLIAEALALAVEYVRGARMEGDIAEFGSHGRTSGIICRTVKNFRMKKSVHLFDSFEGLPTSTQEADFNSPLVKNQLWGQGASRSGLTPQRLQIMMERFLPAEQIRIFPGWYKDTLSTIPEGTVYAMIHIDCDLYESTVEVLDYLFSHGMITEGCIILFDDWNSNHASPRFGERKAWRDMTEKYSVEFSDSGPYSWDGHRFHIHSYTRRPNQPVGAVRTADHSTA